MIAIHTMVKGRCHCMNMIYDGGVVQHPTAMRGRRRRRNTSYRDDEEGDAYGTYDTSMTQA
jgi:hypothetical protein